MTKAVVITGSTRGIGFGMADAFLRHGCRVVVSGRTQEAVDRAVDLLAAHHVPDRVFGQACNVTSYEQVQALWDAAAARWGRIDIWVNNAGLGNQYRPFWRQSPPHMEAVVRTNMLGMMYGSHVAFLGMERQGSGQIYNMEGFGSRGRMRPGLTIYGSTKAGVTYFSRSMIEEMKGSVVQMGTLSPGMVVTDMLTKAYDDPAELERYKRIFNILADPVEDVAPWLVDRMLANTRHGAHIRRLTTPRLIGKFLSAPFRRRDLFAGEAGSEA
ncbi:MAG: SDR family oxidoreductase [Anaerolineae bacterium]